MVDDRGETSAPTYETVPGPNNQTEQGLGIPCPDDLTSPKTAGPLCFPQLPKSHSLTRVVTMRVPEQARRCIGPHTHERHRRRRYMYMRMVFWDTAWGWGRLNFLTAVLCVCIREVHRRYRLKEYHHIFAGKKIWSEKNVFSPRNLDLSDHR